MKPEKATVLEDVLDDSNYFGLIKALTNSLLFGSYTIDCGIVSEELIAHVSDLLELDFTQFSQEEFLKSQELTRTKLGSIDPQSRITQIGIEIEYWESVKNSRSNESTGYNPKLINFLTTFNEVEEEIFLKRNFTDSAGVNHIIYIPKLLVRNRVILAAKAINMKVFDSSENIEELWIAMQFNKQVRILAVTKVDSLKAELYQLKKDTEFLDRSWPGYVVFQQAGIIMTSNETTISKMVQNALKKRADLMQLVAQYLK